MNIFYEMASRLGFYKDVKNCLLKGFTPCAVTGVSNIHKAQTAMALSRLSPCLVICDDEASAIRMTGDINEMAGEQLACVFPAKDLNFAYMEGVSREYEHKRLEALSLITQGKCKIIAASMEACLQGTIPQDKLKEFSFEIKTGGELIQSDVLQEGDLCKTLEAYLDHNCNAAAAAEHLFIHRNTMRYRMDKIKKILCCELDDLDVYLELKMAFEIKNYRESQKDQS